jgi:hypothetical protein
LLGRGDVLAGATLRAADLRKKDLKKQNLDHSDLEAADLRGQNLAGRNLYSTYLAKADLIGADLHGATLHNLRGAKLRGANLKSAELNLACLEGADLGEADLEGANLGDAILNDADLRSANLANANLDGAILKGADLRDVRGLTQPQLRAALGGDRATRLPAGFQIADLASKKVSKDQSWLLHYPARRVYAMSDEARSHLRRYEGAIYDYLRPVAFLAKYRGAKADEELARQIESLLADCREHDDGSQFFAVVCPPGSPDESFTTSGPLSSRPPYQTKRPELVFFGEAARDTRKEDWWKREWDEAEHAALLAAGEKMAGMLKAVSRKEHCIGYVNWIVFNMGKSPTGAELGVISTFALT